MIKCYELNIFAGKQRFTSLPSIVCTGNPYSKMFLTRTFFYFASGFSKFLLHILRRTNAQLCQENISSTMKQL